MDVLNTLTDTLLSRLLWTSAQAVILIAAVWLISRLLPRLSSALRCVLWWLVGVQLIVGLCWSTPLELPLLTQSAPASVAVYQVSGSDPSQEPSANAAGAQSALLPLSANTPTATGWWAGHWRHALLSIWLAALIAQCLLAIRQWREARQLLRESRAPDKTLLSECERQSQLLGLRTPPTLRLSDAITSPQVSGLWHPIVWLPSDQHMTAAEVAMALSHEMAHLRRGDLWLGCVPAIAQRLFFFHPLVLWAVREYALQREAACDEQVLQQAGTEPHAYGQLLVRLGVTRPPHAGLAGASPTFQNLKRRLIMLQQNNHPSRRSGPAWLLIALIALIGVLPYRVTAGGTHPTSSSSSLPAPPPSQAPPMQPPPAPPALPHAPPPPPALPPAPPEPPAPPIDHSGFTAHHVSIETSSQASDGFALFSDDAVMLKGTTSDIATAKRLQQGSQPMLWFRHGDKAWLVRDKATLKRARAIYQPVSQVAEVQGRLAGKQGEVAGRQAGMAARSAGFAERQAAVAEQQAQLVEQNAEQSTHASAEVEARQRSLQAQQDALSREQNRVQAEVGRKQSELSAQQAELSRQQAQLSQRQQHATQKATRQIRQLMEEARANGLAQPATAG